MFLASTSRHSLRQSNRFSSLYAVTSAALHAIGETVLHPIVVLPAIAFLLGGSNYQVAAFAAIALASWALAPLLMLMLRSISGRPYPIVFGAGIVRLGAIAAVGVMGFRIDDVSADRIVSTLIGSYLAYQVASAIAVQASASLIASGVPGSRQVITFRRRSFAAVAAAVAGACAVWSVFRSDESFQDSVGLILMFAAIAIFSATWFLLSIPGGAVSSPMPRPGRLPATINNAFRAAAFRRYISFKLLLALAAAVDPFLIVYGFQQLGLDVEHIGWAIVAIASGQAVGFLVWPAWVARHGPRVPFQVATLLRLLLLTWVVALPTISTSRVYADRFDSPDAAMRGFALGFVLLGLAASAGNVANQRYVMEIAPRDTVQGSVSYTHLTLPTIYSV